MKRILLLIVLLQVFIASAQPGVAPVVEREGQKYYSHTVQAGNTLWGLKSMYGVSIEDIMTTNPELKDGLKVGQVVYIPVGEEEVSTSELELSNYKVKKGETLYGLSKKFNVSVEQLIGWNPELEDGLKKGQTIKVPKSDNLAEEIEEEEVEEEVTSYNPFVNESDSVVSIEEQSIKVTFDDEVVKHTVQHGETMYSISKRFMVPIKDLMSYNKLSSTSIKPGQVLKIPLKKEHIETVRFKNPGQPYNPDSIGELNFAKKDKYKIAVLAPFFLDYGAGYSKFVSDLATQFYMGSKLALDSLEKKGLNAEVFYYDTKSDSTKITEILNKLQVQNVDLIVGPFYKHQQGLVADFCKRNKIRMVIPASSDESILVDNPLVYASVPDDKILFEGMADHFIKNGTSKVILVKPTSKADLELFEAFKARVENTDLASKLSLSICATADIKGYLSRDRKNIIVVPSNDKKFAMKLMETVSRSDFRSRPDQIEVYGTKDWVDITEMNNIYKNKYNFHFATYNFDDFYTDEMIELNKIYRSNYKTDLTKMAAQAYDVMLYFCSEFYLESKATLMINDFKMSQIDDNSGYTNRNIYIIEQEDYELLKVIND